jgi:hypothetical protein
MTTFILDGPIVSIVTESDFSIQSLAAGTVANPVTINPSGAKRTIIIGLDGPSPGQNLFQLSATFNVGDIVEIYNDSATGTAMLVNDENGNGIQSQGLANPGGDNHLPGSSFRKLRSSAGWNWRWLRFG